MKTTSLQVIKSGPNQFLVQVNVVSHVGPCSNILAQFWGYAHSISELQEVLGLTNHRETQRVGSSMSFAHRCRTTKYGELCLSVSWDGDYSGERYKYLEVGLTQVDFRRRKNFVVDLETVWESIPFSFKLDDVSSWAAGKTGSKH